MEPKFYVVQEVTAGKFATLSTMGFRPRNDHYTPLTFDVCTAHSLAFAFIEETGRKCWAEEVK